MTTDTERAELILNLQSLLDDQTLDFDADQREIISAAAALLAEDKAGGDVVAWRHVIKCYSETTRGPTTKTILSNLQRPLYADNSGHIAVDEVITSEPLYTHPQQPAQVAQPQAVPAGLVIRAARISEILKSGRAVPTEQVIEVLDLLSAAPKEPGA